MIRSFRTVVRVVLRVPITITSDTNSIEVIFYIKTVDEFPLARGDFYRTPESRRGLMKISKNPEKKRRETNEGTKSSEQKECTEKGQCSIVERKRRTNEILSKRRWNVCWYSSLCDGYGRNRICVCTGVLRETNE